MGVRRLCRRLLKLPTLLRRLQKLLKKLPFELPLRYKMDTRCAPGSVHPNRGYMHCLLIRSIRLQPWGLQLHHACYCSVCDIVDRFSNGAVDAENHALIEDGGRLFMRGAASQ